ncbi:MAG: 3D domain-containing protein [Clostridia bacterium]|nr:3D domain-containing protein [Clostridia bacterium]
MNGRGITASGVRARRWHTIAASRSYPFGTRIHIPALGKTFVVQDRGGAIRGNRLDLFVGDRKEALRFGRRRLVGIVLERG